MTRSPEPAESGPAGERPPPSAEPRLTGHALQNRMLATAPFDLAPRSLDRVRIIRRSRRCFAFGLIGLTPVVGTALASQALSLGRSVSRELGEEWRTPPLYVYWLAGLGACWLADQWLGYSFGLLVCMLLLAAQTWHLRRSFDRRTPGEWNPGWPQLFWGMASANAGLALSLWLLGSLLSWVCRMNFNR